MKTTPARPPFETLLVMVLGGVGIYLFTQYDWILYTVLVLGVSGLLSPWFRDRIVWAWDQLTHLLGRINGTILLTLVFALVLTPLAWLRRLTRRQAPVPPDSYFHTRGHTYRREDLEQMF
ncbi:MAG: SxtJ family membrane protein [Bacteroidia bacterium]|nr:SxtJ family membrane protein [Bacteroidia bacterium]